jgi:TonB-linked SusC/RagA family outer membrane protein
MGRFVRSAIAIACATALLPALAVAQQSTTISGRVTSDAGAPLNSASVFLEGMSIGSLTDQDGKYTFTVPSARVKGQAATLTARLIGFKAQSVQITLNAGNLTQNFTLGANPLRLGEVVVTGEGTSLTRERLGTAVNTVDTTLISRSNETNVVSALAGKAPNVEVVSQSGDPGSSSYIRIRGPKTISGDAQPLFIVDGVPIDNSTMTTEASTGGVAASNRASDINPDDIATIDVQKGAAASAIYGARAGAGVVIITTKKGLSGQTRYSLRTNYSFDNVTQGPPLQTEFGHGSGGLTPACDASQSPILDCAATSSSFGPQLAQGTPVFNHFSDLFVTGHNWNTTMDLSGGNDRTLYFVSGSLDNNHGDITGPNDWYKKNTVRVNASHQMLDNLKVGIDAQYADVRAAYIQQGSNIDGLLLGSLRTPPEFNNFDFLDPTSHLQRSYRFPWPSVNSTFLSRQYDNPVFAIYDQTNTSALTRTFGNANIEWDALDWLKIKEVFGADYYTDQRLDALPYTSSGQPIGQVIEGDLKNYQIDHNLTASITHTFSPSASASLTVGQNLNSRTFRQIFVTGTGLVAAQPFTLGNTTTFTPNDFQTYEHAERYFGKADVYLWNQLNLEGSITDDGFSTFGINSQRHLFPSGNAAWTFLQTSSDHKGILNYGKLRAAYGEAGIEPNPYSTLQTFASGFTVGDAGWGDGLFINQAGLGGLTQGGQKAQPNLGPERTKEFETGVDLGLLNNHMDASVTAYIDRTEQAIFSLPLAASTGFSSITSNAAVIRNRGIETSLNFRPIMQQDLTWEVGLNWSKNENRLVNLSGQQFTDLPTGGGFTGAVPTAWYGLSVGVLRGNDFARCGRNLNIAGVGDIDAQCGDAPKGALFIGSDGYPILDPTQRVISDGNPKWLGSLHTSVTYKKLTVSGLLDVRHGGQTWDGTMGALYNFGVHADTKIRGTDVVFGKQWFPGAVGGPGAGMSVPLDQAWFTNLGSGFGPVGTQFVEDAGFVKLREIGVAYSLDQPFIKQWGFSSIDIRIAGRNLKTWTNYRGIDPEANLAGASSLIQGVDYFNNPQTRSFVLSLGLNR